MEIYAEITSKRKPHDQNITTRPITTNNAINAHSFPRSLLYLIVNFRWSNKHRASHTTMLRSFCMSTLDHNKKIHLKIGLDQMSHSNVCRNRNKPFAKLLRSLRRVMYTYWIYIFLFKHTVFLLLENCPKSLLIAINNLVLDSDRERERENKKK